MAYSCDKLEHNVITNRSCNLIGAKHQRTAVPDSNDMVISLYCRSPKNEKEYADILHCVTQEARKVMNLV